jgi:hypothetical protein
MIQTWVLLQDVASTLSVSSGKSMSDCLHMLVATEEYYVWLSNRPLVLMT